MATKKTTDTKRPRSASSLSGSYTIQTRGGPYTFDADQHTLVVRVPLESLGAVELGLLEAFLMAVQCERDLVATNKGVSPPPKKSAPAKPKKPRKAP